MTHHSIALGFPSRLLPFVTEVKIFSTGIGVLIKQDAVRRFFVSAHLPHTQRTDCLDMWQKFQTELDEFLHARRLHDSLIICIDTNYELGAAELTADASACDERCSLSNILIRSQGLEYWPPDDMTWQNTRGSETKIDYVLASQPNVAESYFRVVPDSDVLIGSDHKAVLLTQCLDPYSHTKPRRPDRHRSGKWKVNTHKAVEACNSLAEKLDLGMGDLTMASLSQACSNCSFRDMSCRYKDPPRIRALIQERRRLSGSAARELGRHIVQQRAIAKQEWLTTLLDRGAAGDYKAISYFKRRQSSLVTQCNYLTRAGGRTKAVCDLKLFYKLKYTPPDPRPKWLAIEDWRSSVGPIIKRHLFTSEEIKGVLATCKHGKSSGADGISYEFLQILLQTDLGVHLVDYFNCILLGIAQVPRIGLSRDSPLSRKLLARYPRRTFVPLFFLLSPVRCLLNYFSIASGRTSPLWSRANLVVSLVTLEGSCALQQCVRLSNEYGLPLVIAKLDIASAFDTLDHLAVSKFLKLLGPRREAEILLLIISYSTVLLGLADSSWAQDVDRGILQGSSYSAEVFARTVDFFLGELVQRWQQEESTWIYMDLPDGGCLKLFNILFADDLVLLAVSFAQLQRLLVQVRDCLAAIGLQLALKKCQILAAPFVQKEEIRVGDTVLEQVEYFRFLGVLIGFKLSCQAVLNARLALATNSFWGHFKLLRRPIGSVRKKLHLLNSYVTSKWRWMSACVRPIQAVQKALKTLHTSFLGCLCRFSSEPFMPLAFNWIVRRRASRMTAQCLDHTRWESIQAQSFAKFWGHAARIPLSRSSPLTIVLAVRNEDWLVRYGHLPGCKRCLGFWPNAARHLQKIWEGVKLIGQPPYWYQAAQDRLGWDEGINRWLSKQLLSPTTYYDDLSHCELHGRMLLQIGEAFKLLAMRHPPVEEPYPSSYKWIAPPNDLDELGTVTFCSDGSSKLAHGSYAVTILAPYAEIESAIIAQGRIDGYCTNIRAEIVAACHAFTLIRQFRQHCPDIPITYMTDSEYVLQILDETIQPTCHVPDTNNLLSHWHKICATVQARPVRAHNNHALNELTDRAAKEAYHFTHFRRVIRRASYDKVYMLKDHQPPTPIPGLVVVAPLLRSSRWIPTPSGPYLTDLPQNSLPPLFPPESEE